MKQYSCGTTKNAATINTQVYTGQSFAQNSYNPLASNYNKDKDACIMGPTTIHKIVPEADAIIVLKNPTIHFAPWEVTESLKIVPRDSAEDSVLKTIARNI